MLDVQIETAQWTAFTVVLDNIVFSGRIYIDAFNHQLVTDFVGFDYALKRKSFIKNS